MKQIILTVLVVCGLLLIGSCKDPEIIVPKPAEDHNNFNRPVFDTTTRASQVFVNDETNRVVYVGDEFYIKIVVFNMPAESLYATAIDSLPFASGLSSDIVSILDAKSNPGYFVDTSKTDAICLKNPALNYVMFAKMLKKDKQPSNIISTRSGVLIKIRCKALKATNGFVDLLPSSLPFLNFWTGGGGSVSSTLYLIKNTLQIHNAKIRISDEYIVP